MPFGSKQGKVDIGFVINAINKVMGIMIFLKKNIIKYLIGIKSIKNEEDIIFIPENEIIISLTINQSRSERKNENNGFVYIKEKPFSNSNMSV